MASSEYLKPKVAVGNMGERKTKNGLFQNIPSYPQLGGFSSSSKVPERNRPLALEKGDLTRKGRPV